MSCRASVRGRLGGGGEGGEGGGLIGRGGSIQGAYPERGREGTLVCTRTGGVKADAGAEGPRRSRDGEGYRSYLAR